MRAISTYQEQQAMKQSKWGYKGSETAINGLTKWLYENTDLNSYRRICNLIIQFGLEHDLLKPNRHINYDDERNVKETADVVAKQIQEKQLFQQFTNWVTKNIVQNHL